jgi:HNH endonuclease
MALKDELLPKVLIPVEQLVKQAGIDVTAWRKNKKDEFVEENGNVYKNFLWAFGGGVDPVALCVWHKEISWEAEPREYVGNFKQMMAELKLLSDKALFNAEKGRLGIKMRRAYEFAKLVRIAYLRQAPVRFIILEGERAFGEQAATTSSKVRARLLDPVHWFVHRFDIEGNGEYKIIRGIPRLTKPIPGPFDGIEDPGLDPDFQSYVATLSETERDSLIKVRVGQGTFRDGLFARWNGCSVTGCSAKQMLVASHIKPWSRCETTAERLGNSNGILLTPNLDRAFDRGLMSFDDKFQMLVSSKLAVGHRAQLGLTSGSLRIDKRGSDLLPFLQWHRQHIFEKVV